MGKDKPNDEDIQKYIKDKKKKYGENWKDRISFGPSGKWKPKPKPESNVRDVKSIKVVDPTKKGKYKGGGMAGMRRYFRGGKV